LNDRLERVVDQLDELAARWQSLRLAEGLTLEWPRPERR